MADNWYFGNAADDGADNRGWILGHFMKDADGVRQSDDVEIKWGIHPADEHRENWYTAEHRTTVLLLVKGRFRLELPTESGLRALHIDPDRPGEPDQPAARFGPRSCRPVAHEQPYPDLVASTA